MRDSLSNPVLKFYRPLASLSTLLGLVLDLITIVSLFALSLRKAVSRGTIQMRLGGVGCDLRRTLINTTMSHKRTYRIAVLPGDGIGLEVTPPALRCLQAVSDLYGFHLTFVQYEWASCTYYLKHGTLLPENWKELLQECDAIYFGAVGDPANVPDHVSLWGSLLRFRREFDQYINLRPCRLMPGVPSPLANREPGSIDFVTVRENTEGEYSSIGGRIFEGTDRETVIQNTVFTRVGVDRVIRYAFELAQTRKKRLTSATKSNGISITMPYWDERVAAISEDYPDVKVEKYHIDILCAHFVQRPQMFDVVVGSNLFGDILSDLGPACTGTIGIAPSANLNPSAKRGVSGKEWMPSLFEPVHGSAPDIAGKGIANPVGMIWAGQMMLEHLGEKDAASAMLSAIEKVLGEAKQRLLHGELDVLTPDMGGKGTTESLGGAIEKAIREDRRN